MENNYTSKDNILDTYYIINDCANSNIGIQALSGLIGFPVALAIDATIIFTHYAPMINNIRRLYCLEPFSKDYLVGVIKNISSEILFDFMFDKLAGQIPVVGIYFNAICAKAFTWRLGILFAILSRTNESSEDDIKNIARLIRNMFPQKDIFKFTKPDYQIFKKILLSAEDTEFLFKDRVADALKAFEI